MANFCNYEILVSGTENACCYVYASMVSSNNDGNDNDKEIIRKNLNGDHSEVFFRGVCDWSVNYGMINMLRKVNDLKKKCEEKGIDLLHGKLNTMISAGYSNFTLQSKSKLYDCVIKVHYWSAESDFDKFEVFDHGKCTKKRQIHFEGEWEEDSTFDWDTEEFEGQKGVFDESVDGEESDLQTMAIFGGNQPNMQQLANLQGKFEIDLVIFSNDPQKVSEFEENFSSEASDECKEVGKNVIHLHDLLWEFNQFQFMLNTFAASFEGDCLIFVKAGREGYLDRCCTILGFAIGTNVHVYSDISPALLKDNFTFPPYGYSTNYNPIIYIRTLLSFGYQFTDEERDIIAKYKDFRVTGLSTLKFSDLPIVRSIEGTAYEGRNARIEHITKGDSLILKADWNNKFYHPVAIEVFNTANETLGYLEEAFDSEIILEVLAHNIDSLEAVVDSVTPLSKRKKNAKYALMNVKISAKDQLDDSDDSDEEVSPDDLKELYGKLEELVSSLDTLKSSMEKNNAFINWNFSGKTNKLGNYILPIPDNYENQVNKAMPNSLVYYYKTNTEDTSVSKYLISLIPKMLDSKSIYFNQENLKTTLSFATYNYFKLTNDFMQKNFGFQASEILNIETKEIDGNIVVLQTQHVPNDGSHSITASIFSNGDCITINHEFASFYSSEIPALKEAMYQAVQEFIRCNHLHETYEMVSTKDIITDLNKSNNKRFDQIVESLGLEAVANLTLFQYFTKSDADETADLTQLYLDQYQKTMNTVVTFTNDILSNFETTQCSSSVQVKVLKKLEELFKQHIDLDDTYQKSMNQKLLNNRKEILQLNQKIELICKKKTEEEKSAKQKEDYQIIVDKYLDAIKKLDDENARIKKLNAKVKEDRQKFINEKLAQYQSKHQKEINDAEACLKQSEEDFNTANKNYNKEAVNLQTLKKELSELGLFSFGKKELKQRIQDSESKVRELREKREHASKVRSSCELERDIAINNKIRFENEINDEANSKYQLHPIEDVSKTIQSLNETLIKDVVQWQHFVSVKELKKLLKEILKKYPMIKIKENEIDKYLIDMYVKDDFSIGLYHRELYVLNTKPFAGINKVFDGFSNLDTVQKEMECWDHISENYSDKYYAFDNLLNAYTSYLHNDISRIDFPNKIKCLRSVISKTNDKIHYYYRFYDPDFYSFKNDYINKANA